MAACITDRLVPLLLTTIYTHAMPRCYDPWAEGLCQFALRAAAQRDASTIVQDELRARVAFLDTIRTTTTTVPPPPVIVDISPPPIDVTTSLAGLPPTTGVDPPSSTGDLAPLPSH